ncbi:hypothetical protein VPNG_02833 [Cytospora leucostoma]|uniref:Heterokaryon incompatibility domain-containing protein n=1 Tax=Cytospora leucostoma TaxID=1230097 RepID=A0A423XJF6_9PEZI|nr:hypothetical protein VPNG_02833 [Cytospora leucostoma]
MDFDENVQIQLHVLCAKCKVLKEQMQKPLEFDGCFQRRETRNHKYLLYEHYDTVTLLRDSLLRISPAPNSTSTTPSIQLVSSGDEELELSTDIKFAALSYCWGEYPGLRLLSSNYRDLTIDVPFDQVSPTIQDSVLVTIELGIQYLWVDALCIIQDSPGDWNREAPKMYDVYQGCSVTPSASGASDSGDGLFALRDPLRHNPIVTDDWEVTLIKFSTPSPTFSFPWRLETRGWAQQEQLLSARNIKFGSFVIWQCNELVTTEFAPLLTFSRSQAQIASEFWSLVIRPERTHPCKIKDIRLLWHEILQEYMNKELTVRSDRLAAIMGLASAFHRRTGWRLVYGLWEPFILQELLWRRHCAAMEPTGLRPSWSWASWDGGVNIPYPPVTAVPTEVAEYIRISGSVDGQTQSHTPPVLELSGVLFPAREAESQKGFSMDRGLGVEGWPITVEAQYDQKYRPWTDDQLLLPLILDGFSSADVLRGLVIVPAVDSGKFERIGLFSGELPNSEEKPAELRTLRGTDGKDFVRQKILVI